ncbi:MAG TPA: hypothetical protein VMO47_09260 [Rhodothermales bacterium]|nr:hypothetical protein [Rhodothermales bacterium]
MAIFYALAATLYPARETDVPGFDEIRAGFYVEFQGEVVLFHVDAFDQSY